MVLSRDVGTHRRALRTAKFPWTNPTDVEALHLSLSSPDLRRHGLLHTKPQWPHGVGRVWSRGLCRRVRRPSVCSRNRCQLSFARFAQLPTYIARGAGVYRQAAAAQLAVDGGAVRPSVRQVILRRLLACQCSIRIGIGIVTSRWGQGTSQTRRSTGR